MVTLDAQPGLTVTLTGVAESIEYPPPVIISQSFKNNLLLLMSIAGKVLEVVLKVP